MSQFANLGLSAPILRALNDKGYTQATPIQLKAIPAVLTGADIMAAAQTGTGKTAGFAAPLLQRLSTGSSVKANHIRALILTPTRELAAQVAESVAAYGKHLPLTSAVVFGGVKINPQMSRLRRGVDVLIATPGRLIDLYNQNAVKFSQVEILVLDEADRMLDMGFIRDIKKLMALLPKQRQTLLFSATFSNEIRQLTRSILKTPVQIEVTPKNAAANTVQQAIYCVDKPKKTALISHLIRSNGWQQVLIFTRTKHGANKLTRQLEQDKINAAAIHSNKSQGARTRALADFKAGDISVLVATDIAARGIDIIELPHVVNYDLPYVAGDYIHRIGRTGRAGIEGNAISLVSNDEIKLLNTIEQLIQRKIERKVEHNFSPLNAFPNPALKPLNSGRPHKRKQQSAKQSTGAAKTKRPSNNYRKPQGNSRPNRFRSKTH